MREARTVAICGVLVLKSISPNGTLLLCDSWLAISERGRVSEATYTDPSHRHFVGDFFRFGDEYREFLAGELVRAKACCQITNGGLENTSKRVSYWPYVIFACSPGGIWGVGNAVIDMAGEVDGLKEKLLAGNQSKINKEAKDALPRP